MSDVKLIVIDCSKERKFKPFQNLSILGFTFFMLLTLFTLLFQHQWADIGFSIFLLMSGVFLLMLISITLVLKLAFKTKQLNEIIIKNDYLLLENVKYDLSNCFLDLNLENSSDLKIDVNKLPSWGNYIYLNNIDRFEIDPKLGLVSALELLRIKNSPRSLLSGKSWDLFKDMMNWLWAAS